MSIPKTPFVVVGVIAGIILGNTERGRRAYKEAGKLVAGFWRDPRVQARVEDIEQRVATVPVVGEDVAGFIKANRPDAA